MGRLIEPKCRICRRAKAKLMLKGDKCLSIKCVFEKRKQPPGNRSKRGNRITNYLLQIREKQKLKKMYGLFEQQFKNLFNAAEKMSGPTGENFILLLERRLDNVLVRSCFATSRQLARQLIRHGHILIKNRRVNIPSYRVRAGDVITVKEKSRKLYPILKSMTALENAVLPPWLSVDGDNFTITVNKLPVIADIALPVKMQLIIELYSKV